MKIYISIPITSRTCDIQDRNRLASRREPEQKVCIVGCARYSQRLL